MESKSKYDCCQKLGSKVIETDLYSCCKFATLVLWEWQFEICTQSCTITNSETEAETKTHRCCLLACGLRYLKVIGEKPYLNGIDAEGLKFSFLLSVS